jgi:catechol 2,3-dioxygenase-like lactoylglutathione lyase family enzyme
MTVTLDHIGYVGRDLTALRTTFARLGFAPTEPRPLMGRDPASGALVPLGQSSCHLVFERGYVELSSVHGDDPAHHLAAWLARPTGVHILALGADDISGARERSARNGLAAGELRRAARAVEYGARRGEARFAWFMLAARDFPEALVCFVRNETPELVFQPEVQQHPNGARGLAEVRIVARDADACAGRYRLALGIDPVFEQGRARFALGQGELTIETPERFRAEHRPAFERTSAEPAYDRIALVAIEVESLDRACGVLDASGVAYRASARELIVPATEAAGAVLVLREARGVAPDRLVYPSHGPRP